MQFNYVITGQTDPYRNFATEQELLHHTAKGKPILFLWQNADTIVVGRNQNVQSECKADEFTACGGKIARRRSGGGAVYHDLGNMNFSILCKSEDLDACQYQRLILNMLREFQLDGVYNGRNDIMVDGKKISGNAVYRDGDTVCQHGTVLISTDIDRMTYYLTPEKSKLERNHIKSVHTRVVNLSSLNSSIDIKTAVQAFIYAADATEMNCVVDRDRMDALEEFYKSNEWIFGGRR